MRPHGMQYAKITPGQLYVATACRSLEQRRLFFDSGFLWFDSSVVLNTTNVDEKLLGLKLDYLLPVSVFCFNTVL